MTYIDDKLVRAIEKHAIPLGYNLQDYDSIIRASKGKQFVLIGEATHGTHEFYRARAEITERLIQEKGFDAVAVEADWPDAYRVNRFVSCLSNEQPDQALSGFERFPSWMWCNKDVFQFIEWLHAYNFEFRFPDANQKKMPWPTGFYGLDLYSMNTSIHAVLAYLNKVDPAAAQLARTRYGCLDHYIGHPQSYGYAAEFGLIESCEREIVEQLTELRRKAYDYLKLNGFIAEDAFFNAAQNAEVIKNAEAYYRSMFRLEPSSWNLRDKHMFDTLENLTDHLGHRLGREARVVVWAHNSHIGNAAATEMSDRGEYNIGQLVRSSYGDKSLLIGFSTCRGTVTAAHNWEEAPKILQINEPWPRSYEEVFHHVNHKAFMLDLRENNEAVDMLMEPRLQRAIGVVYSPNTERNSHYFHACLPEQFDFMLHYDDTTAVEPLKTKMQLNHGEFYETYPSGL